MEHEWYVVVKHGSDRNGVLPTSSKTHQNTAHQALYEHRDIVPLKKVYIYQKSFIEKLK